jgi:phage gpG-like protein
MADVSVAILDNASPMVRRMAASMHDFREPLATMALILDRSFRKQFIASGKPRWKPLSPKTIFYRRNHSTKPLIDTGRLMKSYIGRTTDGVYNLGSKQLVIGSNLNYAELHQFGGDSLLHEKRWFKSGRGGRPDTQVGTPKYTRTGRVSSNYKLKHINSYVTIKVPARPLKIQPEDIASMKTALERWIIRKAHNTP